MMTGQNNPAVAMAVMTTRLVVRDMPTSTVPEAEMPRTERIVLLLLHK
jgi:hypothetical protein